MPWSTVDAQLVFWQSSSSFQMDQSLPVSAVSSSDESEIRDLLEYIYGVSDTAADILDQLAAAGPINIGTSTANDPGFFAKGGPNNVKYVGLNLQAIYDLHYFNQFGQLVNEQAELAIMHELGASGKDIFDAPAGKVSKVFSLCCIHSVIARTHHPMVLGVLSGRMPSMRCIASHGFPFPQLLAERNVSCA